MEWSHALCTAKMINRSTDVAKVDDIIEGPIGRV